MKPLSHMFLARTKEAATHINIPAMEFKCGHQVGSSGVARRGAQGAFAPPPFFPERRSSDFLQH